jgi:hypothetical protein
VGAASSRDTKQSQMTIIAAGSRCHEKLHLLFSQAEGLKKIKI